MNFGQAIYYLQHGYSVTRVGWNGKGQYVYLIRGMTIQKAFRQTYGEPQTAEEDAIFTDVLALRTTNNKIQVGWLASQADMLAEDWDVVEIDPRV